MPNTLDSSNDVVELSARDGVAFIEQASPLTRLHYFDGQYLRAASLTAEQDYHRHALQLANQAGGWGAVHGLGIALSGDALVVTPGLAVTPNGDLVLATLDMRAKLADLLGVAAPPPATGKAAFDDCLHEKKAPAAAAAAGLQVYEITVGPVEGLCGNEAVFGKLCETACASDSRRPYWREGVVLRLRPVALALPSSTSVPATTTHLRNRIASAYFANEPGQPAPLLSAAGLASGVWCQPAVHHSRDEVVIGLLWRDAGVARIDAWSGRRERMDTQPRAYWQGRMAMRPWNVFTAQILQFQCQLAGLFDANSPVIQPEDDCDRLRAALGDARREIEDMLTRLQGSSKGLVLKSGDRTSFKRLQDVSSAFQASYADLAGLSHKLAGLDTGGGSVPARRMLVNAGFFELPPAGYLPVSPGSDVRPQCERMFGEGVDLHFHAVRHDEIAHLVEEAEHLDRISLTRGLDDPARIEAVEVFVPEGQVSRAADVATGTWWNLRLDLQALAIFEVFDDGTAEAPAADAVPEAPAATVTAPKKTATRQARARAAAAAATPLEQQLEVRDRFVVNRALFDGLVRTESRADGSAAFTAVFGTEAAAAPAEGDATGGSARVFSYLSGDVAQDPFDLPIGGATDCRLEFAGLNTRGGNAVEIRGRLTVLRQRAAADGTQERLVQLDFQLSQQTTRDGQTGPRRSHAGRLRLVVSRDGDQRTGLFVIDDERQDPKTSPVYFDWFDGPRRATMSVNARVASLDTAVRMQSLRGLAGLSQPASKAAEAAAPPEAAIQVNVDRPQELGTAVDTPRQRLLLMAALPAMPEPGSEAATETLNRLAAIAEVNDDGAFLLRARQRLLPTLDAPKVETIRTAADWVMFRRARTHLCGPACTTVPATTTETFQVWHARLESEAELAALRKSLDAGDAGGLAQFKFGRVGLLRYRDESAYAEETDAQVLAMWRAAQPAARVALGRVWEEAPRTGQGWQNHMRLRRMLETIDPLTKAPPAGDGSLQVLAPPTAGELADRATDGGMLVVTLPVQAQLAFHRVVMVPFGVFADLEPLVRRGTPEAMRAFDEQVKEIDARHFDLDMHFDANSALVPADATALAAADRQMRAVEAPTMWVTHALLATTKPAPAGTRPDLQHQAIGAAAQVVWAPPPNGGHHGMQTDQPPMDYGRGSGALSLIGYEAVYIG